MAVPREGVIVFILHFDIIIVASIHAILHRKLNLVVGNIDAVVVSIIVSSKYPHGIGTHRARENIHDGFFDGMNAFRSFIFGCLGFSQG